MRDRETAPELGSRNAVIDAVVFDLGGVLIDWNPRHLYRRPTARSSSMTR
jgi:hypothetical protein